MITVIKGAGVEGAAEAPLGKVTVFASGRSQTALPRKHRRRVAVVSHGDILRHQYELLDFLHSKLPDPGRSFDEKTGQWTERPGERWRVRSCHRIPVLGHDITLERTQRGHAYFGGVNSCNSVWTCPVCSGRIAAYRREELTVAVAHTTAWCGLSTFTLRHSVTDSLADLTAMLRRAYRSMRSGRRWQAIKAEYGYVGSYTSMEFTYSEEHGWHPHLHALDFFRAELDEEQRMSWRRAMAEMWIRTVERVTGQKATKKGEWKHAYQWTPALCGSQELIQAYYAAKWGSSEETWTDLMKRKAARCRTGSIVAEATGSRTKQGRMLRGRHYSPWELLDLAAEGNEEAWQLWYEYAQVTRCMHQGSWSRGLRRYLNMSVELSDFEIPDPEGEVLLEISRSDYAVLCQTGMRGILLSNAGRTGSRMQCQAVLDAALNMYAERVARD